MPRKKTAVPSTTLTPISGTALVSIPDSMKSSGKMPGTGGFIAREEGVTLITDRSYATRDQTIAAAEIYFVVGSKPRETGPWLGEADKVAWRDEATGYECIMLRHRDEAFLSGYVGVPRDHPLWGWEHDAISTDLGIEVHGGLTYSKICEDGPSPRRSIVSEARRICHVSITPVRLEPLDQAGAYRVEDAHAFWFGFDCNHIYDVVPGASRQRRSFLAAETAAVYRDDAYVLREVTNLAAQLKAIADGVRVPPREGPPLPPVGLDPRRGG